MNVHIFSLEKRYFKRSKLLAIWYSKQQDSNPEKAESGLKVQTAIFAMTPTRLPTRSSLFHNSVV